MKTTKIHALRELIFENCSPFQIDACYDETTQFDANLGATVVVAEVLEEKATPVKVC